MVNRWLRPKVYPLFAAVEVVVGICGFQLIRKICINPEVKLCDVLGKLNNLVKMERQGFEHFLVLFI
ncbi:hypothetical protein ACB098_08G149200 [Castanea mollissima]